jgi:urease gamma subunit
LIDIQITIKGENVQNSSFKKYYYPHESDEEIFFNSVQLVIARIEKKLKLNLNEVLTIFLDFLVREYRKKRGANEIKDNLSKLLTHDQVLIGVPELVKNIEFSGIIDTNPKLTVVLDEPILIPEYVIKA